MASAVLSDRYPVDQNGKRSESDRIALWVERVIGAMVAAGVMWLLTETQALRERQLVMHERIDGMAREITIATRHAAEREPHAAAREELAKLIILVEDLRRRMQAMEQARGVK